MSARRRAGYNKKSFDLQREISPGKIPDAFVEIIDGIFIVIDSKAPTPPYDNDVVDDSIAERICYQT
jgi:hypothetical protein